MNQDLVGIKDNELVILVVKNLIPYFLKENREILLKEITDLHLGKTTPICKESRDEVEKIFINLAKEVGQEGNLQNFIMKSKEISENTLKEVIKDIIEEILNEEEVSEASTTGGVAGYNTPYAFGTKNKKGNVKAATQLGYTLAKGVDEKKKSEPKKAEREEPIHRDDLKVIDKNKKSAGYRKDKKELSHLGKIEKLVKQKLNLKEDANVNISTSVNQFSTEIKTKIEALKKGLVDKLSGQFLNKKVRISAKKNNSKIPTASVYTILVNQIKIEKLPDGSFSVVFVDDSADEYFVSPKNTIVVMDAGVPTPSASHPVTAQQTTKPEAPTDSVVGQIEKT